MSATDVVVVGAGHAGLAMSRTLSQRGVDHVVLERGEVAHSWRTERWDSLRLLTPNWMTRLPGWAYAGDDPDGYMHAAEVADFIAAYAHSTNAPVRTQTAVTRVWADGDRYRVASDRGLWHCRAVVMANGAFGRPVLPSVAAQVPSEVAQWTSMRYRNPAQLADGGVLVVGASATGVQLAHEIRRSGRPVLLAAGEHVRMPRLYRGRDIQWWMHASGVLDQRIEQMDEPERARRVPSPQLAGTPGRATLDLNALQAEGVQVVGRLMGVCDGRPQFSGSLHNVCALADLKMNRLLDSFDAWAQRSGLGGAVGAPQRYAPTAVVAANRLGAAGVSAIRLGKDIRSIIWATGLRPDYRWLQVPAAFGPNGDLRHDRGVVSPGLIALGLPFLRRRKSSFVHGAEDDVRELAEHVLAQLARTAYRRGVHSHG